MMAFILLQHWTIEQLAAYFPEW